MSKISINLTPVSYDTININALKTVPVLETLMPYYQGSKEEYGRYLRDIGIEPRVTFASMHELTEYMNYAAETLKRAFEAENTDKFDFRAVSVLNSKLFGGFSEDDYFLLRIDLSSFEDAAEKDVVKEAFFKSPTKSFMSFKELDGDVLNLYYHKKAITEDENGKVAIYSTRNKVTMAEGYKAVKDANFVCSGFLLNMSKFMQANGLGNSAFDYSYERSDGSMRNIVFSADEIVNIASMPKEQKDEIAQQAAIKESVKDEANEELQSRAKEELKSAKAKSRQSLEPESTDDEILKSSSAQVRFDKDILEKDIDLDAELERLFDEYDKKELAKKQHRLKEAREQGYHAYADLKNNIKDGVGIADAIKYIQQQHKNEDTINFAFMLLSKDFLEGAKNERKIEKLNETIGAYRIENEKLVDVVAKRENTISELKSTLAKKMNDINKMAEKYEDDIKSLTHSSKKALDDMQAQHKKDISEYQSVIDELDKLMPKMQAEMQNLQKDNQEKTIELNSTKQELEKYRDFKVENKMLMEQNKELKEKIKDLENRLYGAVSQQRNERLNINEKEESSMDMSKTFFDDDSTEDNKEKEADEILNRLRSNRPKV